MKLTDRDVTSFPFSLLPFKHKSEDSVWCFTRICYYSPTLVVCAKYWVLSTGKGCSEMTGSGKVCNVCTEPDQTRPGQTRPGVNRIKIKSVWKLQKIMSAQLWSVRFPAISPTLLSLKNVKWTKLLLQSNFYLERFIKKKTLVWTALIFISNYNSIK